MKLPKELKVPSGDKLRIEGLVEGEPSPQTYWLREMEKIQENERMTIQTMNGRSILTLKRPQREDSGEYILRAENQHGKTQDKVQVEILSTYTCRNLCQCSPMGVHGTDTMQ